MLINLKALSHMVRLHHFTLILLFCWSLSGNVTATDQPPFMPPALARGSLLIAGENLQDPNFERTIILITGYDEFGTHGLVINRRTKIPGPEVMPRLRQVVPLLDHLYIGGPVRSSNISILVKSAIPLAGATAVTGDIYLIDTFEQFSQLPLKEMEPENLRVYSGYAGWGPGQLESEIIRGDWHLWQADTSIIFAPAPGNLWDELIRMVSAKWVLR